MKEVGTTNRTRISDYEMAICPETRLLLRVHPSNFNIIGFTEKPNLDDFVGLGRKHGIHTFEDLGSGCLIDLNPLGIRNEPTVAQSIQAGVDIVCFSGDKLLGGPQAGIIAGSRKLIDRLRKNQLFRALRVDKLTMGALEVVLRGYAEGTSKEIPVMRMLTIGEDALKKRAKKFSDKSGGLAEAVPVKSIVGGGSAPGAELPSWGGAVKITGLSAVELERRFRSANPAVIVRVEGNLVLLDMRTIAPDEEDEVLTILRDISSRFA